MDIFGLKLILVTALIFIPFERLFALRERKIFRRHWGNDLIFLLLNGLMIKAGLVVVIAAAIFVGSQVVPASIKAGIGNLPLWVQIPMAVFLADLGFYWTHRMFHWVPWLWRFHAVHHSIEELDWLAASRVHPLDQILTKGVSLVPVLTLGFSEFTIGAFALLYYWQSVLIHSNVRIKFGCLRLLFASPEFHHWHHSNDREARDRNFAGQLSFLDALFGTLHMPAGRMPVTYGLDQPMPQRYPTQLLYPFVGDRAEQINFKTKGANELRIQPAGVDTMPRQAANDTL